jgi:NAD-dependent dihydropyrimidine dehydrogenase PreA subunit
MRPFVDEDTCIGCGLCEDVCPADPNVFDVGGKSEVVHPEACIDCKACEESCPVNAIVLKEEDI